MRLGVLGLLFVSSSAFAHGGLHLEEKTLAAIFQFVDRTYASVLAYWPHIAGITAGLIALLVTVKVFRANRQ